MKKNQTKISTKKQLLNFHEKITATFSIEEKFLHPSWQRQFADVHLEIFRVGDHLLTYYFLAQLQQWWQSCQVHLFMRPPWVICTLNWRITVTHCVCCLQVFRSTDVYFFIKLGVAQGHRLVGTMSGRGSQGTHKTIVIKLTKKEEPISKLTVSKKLQFPGNQIPGLEHGGDWHFWLRLIWLGLLFTVQRHHFLSLFSCCHP